MRLATGSVDVVFTNSVLEHVPDMVSVLAECARITKPGGFGLHGIDFRDHRFYGNSAIHKLEFLCESRAEPMVGGCNRLRGHEVVAAFDRNGFEALESWTLDDLAIDAALRECRRH